MTKIRKGFCLGIHGTREPLETSNMITWVGELIQVSESLILRHIPVYFENAWFWAPFPQSRSDRGGAFTLRIEVNTLMLRLRDSVKALPQPERNGIIVYLHFERLRYVDNSYLHRGDGSSAYVFSVPKVAGG